MLGAHESVSRMFSRGPKGWWLLFISREDAYWLRLATLKAIKRCGQAPTVVLQEQVRGLSLLVSESSSLPQG